MRPMSIDHVHEHAPPQGLALHVADQVPLVVAGVDAVVGVEQFDREHGGVLAAHRNRPGIGLRLLGRVLLGIIDHHALQRAVGVQGNECRPVLFPAVLGDEEGRAVIRRLGRPGDCEAPSAMGPIPKPLSASRRPAP